jgi:hypothetical protein
MRPAIVACIVLLGGCGANTLAPDDLAVADLGGADASVGDLAASDLSGAALVLDPNPAAIGNISVASESYTGYRATSGFAQFSTYAGSTLGPCAHATIASCTLASCPRTDGGGAAPGPPRTPVSAGTLTFSGVGAPVTFDASGALTVPGMGVWSGGETLSVQASGADVAAFTVSLTAPGRARVLTPPRPSDTNARIAIDRASGFTVTWTPAPSGTLAITISTDHPDAFLSLECETAASAGSYTVPATALLALPTDGAGSTVLAETRAEASVLAGTSYFPVRFVASASAIDDALDLPWIAGVTLQ